MSKTKTKQKQLEEQRNLFKRLKLIENILNKILKKCQKQE